jgi:ATP-dependent exoDNAse (exonuclease V) beta subunit
LIGNPAVRSFIGVDSPDAILARTNATVMSSVLEALSAERTPHIVGGIGELLRLLNAVRDLKQGRSTDVAEFFGFQDWSEVVEHSKLPEGEQIRTFVSLVESFGEERLIRELRKTADNEKDADLVISTAHKAKGREWDCVRLAGDFMPSLPSEAKDGSEGCADPESEAADGEVKRKDNLAELRLFYVALTRARRAVDVEPATLENFGIAKSEEYKNPRQARSTPIKMTSRSQISSQPPSSSCPSAPKAPISQRPSARQSPLKQSSSGGTIAWVLIALAVVFFVFG